MHEKTSFMRVDAHQHFWLYHAPDYPWMDNDMSVLQQDFLPEDLAPVLRRHNMDGCVAVQSRPDAVENEFLLALSSETPLILGIVGWVDFCAKTVAQELERWNICPKMKGYRAMVQDEPDPSAFLADKHFNAGVTEVHRSGKLYELLVHSKDLKAAANFCGRHSDGAIVLCHMGKPAVLHESAADWGNRLAPLAGLEHVFCKMSGLITEAECHAWSVEQLLPYLEKALDLFGPDRLIFGSDWPVCLCSGTADQVYGLAETALAGFSCDEKAKVWGGNATRVYNLATIA